MAERNVTEAPISYPTMDIAMDAARSKPNQGEGVPVARRQYTKWREFTGYEATVIDREDLVIFPRIEFSASINTIESKDEAPHGGGCKIQKLPQDFKHPGLGGPSQEARAVLAKIIPKDGWLPVARRDEITGDFTPHLVRRKSVPLRWSRLLK